MGGLANGGDVFMTLNRRKKWLLYFLCTVGAGPAMAKDFSNTLYDGFDKRANQLSVKDDEFVNNVMRPKMQKCGEQQHVVEDSFFYVRSSVETYYLKAVLLRAKLVSGVNRSAKQCEGEISMEVLKEWELFECSEIKDQVVSFCEWSSDEETPKRKHSLVNKVKGIVPPEEDPKKGEKELEL